MQKGKKIFQNCQRCNGTGKLYDRDNYEYLESSPTITTTPTNYEEVQCSDCDGLGIIHWGWVRDEKEETMPGEEA